MILKVYLERLEHLIKQNPKILNHQVIYSHDDEGNEYQKVYFEPSLCTIKDLSQQYLELEEPIYDVTDETETNAVIIN